MKLQTLFLDAGGVLVFPNWARVSETLGRHGVAVAADTLARAEPHAKFALDNEIGNHTARDAARASRYMDLVLAHAGVPPSPETDLALEELREYHARHNLWEHVPASVGPALAALSSRGLRLVVASNANGVLHSLFDRVGLTRHFDVICDSFVEGVEKPDPRFFHVALQRCGGHAAATMHVGDLYHVDVVGARRAGLAATLLDEAGLYGGYDVDRVASLDQLVGLIERT